MARIATLLRQWCGLCAAATVTWKDGAGNDRCSVCDPQDPAAPGYGRADTDDDDED